MALSLTDVSPISWNDDQRLMFENRLAEMSDKFKRLTSVHFAQVSDSFAKPSYQITVTHADGSEYSNALSVNPKQKKKLKDIAERVIIDIKEFSDSDMVALVALLSSRL